MGIETAGHNASVEVAMANSNALRLEIFTWNYSGLNRVGIILLLSVDGNNWTDDPTTLSVTSTGLTTIDWTGIGYPWIKLLYQTSGTGYAVLLARVRRYRS